MARLASDPPPSGPKAALLKAIAKAITWGAGAGTTLGTGYLVSENLEHAERLGKVLANNWPGVVAAIAIFWAVLKDREAQAAHRKRESDTKETLKDIELFFGSNVGATQALEGNLSEQAKDILLVASQALAILQDREKPKLQRRLVMPPERHDERGTGEDE